MTACSIPQDFYVYTHHKATTGEIFYVGKGRNYRAWATNPRSDCWKATVAKHGHIVRIVQDGLQDHEALELEADLIAHYGRRDEGKGPLVNMTDGFEGGSGTKMSAKKRAQMDEFNARPEVKAEFVARMREVKQTEQWRTNHANMMQKLHSTPEYVKALSEGRRAWLDKEENKQEMRRKAKKLNADPAFRAKQKEAIARPVVCIELGIEFASIRDGAKAMGLNAFSGVAVACKYPQRTAKGYHWRYADQPNPPNQCTA